MELSVLKLAVVCYFVLGLSHMVQPRAWVDFFVMLRGKGVSGNFINAFLHLPMGAIIVSFHNVWQGIPAVLTVIGWCYVIKSGVYFVIPRVGLRSLDRVRPEMAWGFVVAGAVMVSLAGLFAFAVVQT